MASTLSDMRIKANGVARHPRTRKIAIWVISVIVAIGVLFGLVTPPLIRGKIAAALSDKFHRPVSIEQLRVNPYAMTASIRGFLMKERQTQQPAVSFDELYINLQLQSLFRLAPIIKELRLVKPYINLVRNPDNKYNFQDLIDEFTSGPPGPSGPGARFALNNIRLIDGRIDFNDQPENTKHTISQINIGVPFISSLPSYTDINVKPEFSAVINGAPFRLDGATLPFKDSHDSSFEINLDRLTIAKYLEYSPVELKFKVPNGQLKTNLKIAFKTSQNSSPTLSISGNVALADLEMQQTDGTPLLKMPKFDATIDNLQVFNNRTALKSVTTEGLELHLKRNPEGQLNVANLVEVPNKPSTAETPKSEKPYGFSVDEVALASSTIYVEDQRPQRPYKTRLENINIKISGLSNDSGKKANSEISFETDGNEKLTQSGAFQLTPLAAEGKLSIEGLNVGALRPYYETALAAEIKEGRLDLATQYSFESREGASPEIKLTDLSANLREFRLDLAGQSEPVWRIASLALKDAAIDVSKKIIVLGNIAGTEGSGYIQRDTKGLNLARIAKASSEPPAAAPAKTNDALWRVDLKQLLFERFRIRINDQSNATPVKIDLADISLRADNFSTAKNQRGKTTVRARINNKGLMRLVGTASLDPISARFAVDARDIDVTPYQPYLTDKVNLLLTGGRIGTKGELTYETGGEGVSKINYNGSARVGDFSSVEQDNNQDLLKWKSLALDGLQYSSEPFELRIGEITLADFYSRLILGADGKVNLQKLTAERPERVEATAEASAPSPAPAEPETNPKPISIGKVNLQSGNINFSDFFIKPNYSANLTSVEGAISELNPEAPGDLNLQAKLDESAPVDIKGKINPFSKDLFLDLIADAREIELSPMTPYSGKYLGYGIEKGKLSFNVKYKLENRKLSAENKIILNQLTFGDKIESPTATKLPVLFAVSLLKDRNGVIDVDLPISGSLDDPQFSVGGIVLRIIINLITKAVTAPFSLLGSVFGGSASGGEELSYIEFASGRASLDQAAQAKIGTLAKALNNRPAVNLEITGRFDPSSDVEGSKQLSIERKVKAQKFKELARKGAAPRSIEDVQVDKSEYPQYLKAAYGEEKFPKPRNLIGLAQDLPVPEMEKLMIQHTQVSEDDLRQLGNQRAQAVRDALASSGQVGSERLFVTAAKPVTAEERSKLKGKPNRVDFSMK
jgi:uncharacterized protein involved in outer membrane biogenesis